MPVSEAFFLPQWQDAPEMCMRISELALPPNTPRSWTSAVLAPCRAEAMAAHSPLMPPPMTTTS